MAPFSHHSPCLLQATASLQGYLQQELAGLQGQVFAPREGESVDIPAEPSFRHVLRSPRSPRRQRLRGCLEQVLEGLLGASIGGVASSKCWRGCLEGCFFGGVA